MIDPTPASAPAATVPLLAGREQEQALLGAALGHALAGRGSLVLIGGEAGIGKTALAEALGREATARGALALVGRCYDLSETPPYGPWRELFARRGSIVDPPPVPAVFAPDETATPVTSQIAVFTQAEDFLTARAARQPLVILLDDLHWADPGSLDLLRVLGRHLADRPILVLATYRTDELSARHPLAALLPVLVREAAAARLDLRPLGEEAVRDLVRGRYRLADADATRLLAYLQQHAEGNPFYLGELLRALEEEDVFRRQAAGWALGDLARARLPTLLRQVIDGRVARLGGEARRLLTVAAVIGQEVALDVWQAVAEVAEDDLLDVVERAATAHLLEATTEGTGVRFVHALIREALYEGLLPPRRRAWHKRVGEALMVTPGKDPNALAHHFRQAGDPRAFAWLVRAGLRAYQAAAWLTAVERFLAASALPDETGARVRARGWLLFGSARLLIFSDNARALRLLDEAEPLALAADDQPLAIHIRHGRGNLLALRGEIRRGVAMMERETIALEALPGERLPSGAHAALAMIAALFADGEPTPAPTAPTLSTYRAQLVVWFSHTGRYREARALGEALIAALDTPASEHPGGLALVHFGLGQAHAALGHPVLARAAFARSRAGQYAANNAQMVGFMLWSELLLAVLPHQADDVAERRRLAAEAAPAWERARGTITDTPHGHPTDLLLALLEGRWAAADRLAWATLTAANAGLAHGAIVALGVLARQQGAPEAAWARVRELHPAGPATEPGDAYFHHTIVMQALAADLALDAGDLATAREWVAAHGRWLDWSGAALWQAEHHRLQACLAAAAGDPAAAWQHAEAALAWATEPRQPLALLAAHRLLGELATALGRLDEGVPHLDAALALADACAAPYERALTLLALAELRLKMGERAEAQAALDAARPILERLEAVPALTRAAALADQTGAIAPAAPTPPAAPAGLSAREVEVLRLLAQGKTNREIAAALSISVKTVNKHVASILGKTNSPNRTGAAAFALRQELG